MSENLTDSLLTHQRQAERLFCGAIFINPDSARHDCGYLDPGDFTDRRYGQFWEAVKAGRDQFTAAMELGIYNELTEATGEIVSSFSYQGFAQTIQDDRYFTHLATVTPKLVNAIVDRDKMAATQIVDNLRKERPSTSEGIPDAVAVALSLTEMVDQERRSLKTGIAPFDHALGGLERGTLIVPAARPSMGKTALASQIARNVAAAGHKVLFFSLEMTAEQIWARATCGALEVSWKDVLDKNAAKLPGGNLDEWRSEAVNLAAKFGENLRIDDSSRLTLDNIWQKVARYQPDLVIVDHQSLVTHPETNPVKRAGAVAWGLKQLAKEFDIPVVMLQQLNRGVEARDQKRPIMSDLRESGELEEVADLVFFLFREDYYRSPDEQPKVSETELIVSKHRNGSRNVAIRLAYHLTRQWFYRLGEV